MNASSTSQALQGHIPTLKLLRSRLSPTQKRLLEEFWQHFYQKLEWPTTRSVYSQHSKEIVRETLFPLGGNIVSDDHNINGQYGFSITLVGALLTNNGIAFQKLLSRLFELQRDLFKAAPNKLLITSQEIQAALALSSDELKSLGLLMRLSNISGGYSNGENPTWSVSAMAEAEDFPEEADLFDYVENWVLRHYRSDALVFREDHFRATMQSNSVASPLPEIAKTLVNPHPTEINPHHKRYQVFVSSTYKDLTVERKHVIQALLATKCIPSGMELFPATSTAQWDLIKKVIDDCDYYIVIVAGKYGSLGPNGKSFTEMEFDYADATGKSILGFFHEDIETLPGSKLEETELAKKQLKAFTAKVKKRLCRPWNSPEGLESALKSAIYNAIEEDPKPGWIRASESKSLSRIRELEERISELEGKPKRRTTADKFPSGEELLEFGVTISWIETDNPKIYSPLRKAHSIDSQCKLTWDEVFLCFFMKPEKTTSFGGLKKIFQNALGRLLEAEARKRSILKHLQNLNANVEGKFFDKVFNTFVAREYFKQIEAPNRSYRRKFHWKLTPKGIRKLAECKALKLNSEEKVAI